MADWFFQYEDLISILDQFSAESNSVEFQETWEYTKKMISAHAFAICPAGTSPKEALSIAWSQFETALDDDENALLSLDGIAANLINAVPHGQSIRFYHQLEIGFSVARGFSREEAEAEHEQIIAQPSWNFIELEIEKAEQAHYHLRLIEGGK